jgi:hypothetical protein
MNGCKLLRRGLSLAAMALPQMAGRFGINDVNVYLIRSLVRENQLFQILMRKEKESRQTNFVSKKVERQGKVCRRRTLKSIRRQVIKKKAKVSRR